MMRIKLALLRIDPILLRIEAVQGKSGLQPLPLDPAQTVLGPNLLQIRATLHQIDQDSQHRESDSQHLGLHLQHLKPAHGVRDLNLQHLGPDLHQSEGDSHQVALVLMQKQDAMMRIGRLCIIPGAGLWRREIRRKEEEIRNMQGTEQEKIDAYNQLEKERQELIEMQNSGSN